MSNTYHHRNQKQNNWGKDLWSRRPCSGMPKTSYSKKLCRRIERARKSLQINRHIRYFDEGAAIG